MTSYDLKSINLFIIPANVSLFLARNKNSAKHMQVYSEGSTTMLNLHTFLGVSPTVFSKSVHSIASLMI